jgi:hypothetical protein
MIDIYSPWSDLLNMIFVVGLILFIFLIAYFKNNKY